MISAGAMARHEKYCRRNPNNMHKCFDLCSHLKRTTELIPGKSPFLSNSYATVFVCEKTGQKMYSYLLEKKATSYFGCPIKSDGLVRMPLDCRDYKYMSESQYEERFGFNTEDL